MAETEKEAYLALIATHDPRSAHCLTKALSSSRTPSRRTRRRLACRPGQIGNTCEDCNRQGIRSKSALRMTNRAIPVQP